MLVPESPSNSLRKAHRGGVSPHSPTILHKIQPGMHINAGYAPSSNYVSSQPQNNSHAFSAYTNSFDLSMPSPPPSHKQYASDDELDVEETENDGDEDDNGDEEMLAIQNREYYYPQAQHGYSVLSKKLSSKDKRDLSQTTSVSMPSSFSEDSIYKKEQSYSHPNFPSQVLPTPTVKPTTLVTTTEESQPNPIPKTPAPQPQSVQPQPPVQNPSKIFSEEEDDDDSDVYDKDADEETTDDEVRCYLVFL